MLESEREGKGGTTECLGELVESVGPESDYVVDFVVMTRDEDGMEGAREVFVHFIESGECTMRMAQGIWGIALRFYINLSHFCCSSSSSETSRAREHGSCRELWLQGGDTYGKASRIEPRTRCFCAFWSRKHGSFGRLR